MNTVILAPELDDRYGVGKVTSRIGLEAEALSFNPMDDLLTKIAESHANKELHCVLVDEAQFLGDHQVWQLAEAGDQLGIPVMCYGLRTDFQGNLFPGSARLLAIADVIREIRTICHCGSKATMVVRQDETGRVIREGAQIEIGGNERYISLCRKHWRAAMAADQG